MKSPCFLSAVPDDIILGSIQMDHSHQTDKYNQKQKGTRKEII